MAQLFTANCGGDFEEITLDDNHTLEQEIQNLLRKIKQQTDEDEVERQLKMFKSEGLIQSYEGDRDYSKEGGR